MVRLRAVLDPSALVVSSLLTTVFLLEVLVRTLPVLWPPGAYGASRFSPDLSMRVHAVPTIYNQRRWTRRMPNREGFLDVDHARDKPPGVTRVGFFGDSYVEALQVPLEETFFRRLPTEIAGRTIEALAFGISSWGTLHSLMAYRVMGPRYALDDVVYLFVMNDPGDHFHKVRQRQPSAALSDDGTGFVIRNTVRHPNAPGAGIMHFVDRELMFARLVRVQLTRLRAEAESRSGAGAGQASRPTIQNDYPSTWPPALLEEAQRLTHHILRGFRDEVLRDGRRFWVLYVPRGSQELDGSLSPEDSWFPWLSRICAELGIRLLDPRGLLSAHRAAGTTIYDDHWTPAAHALIASFVARALADALTAERPGKLSSRLPPPAAGQ